MASYITTTEYTNAQMGVQTPPAAGELQNTINRACAAVEEFCGRIFVPTDAIVEQLFTNGAGRALIDRNGEVYLYPTLAFPIRSVGALTWQIRDAPLASLTVGGSSSSSTTSPTTVDVVNNTLVELDERGDGNRIRVFLDFTSFRSPSTTLQFNLTWGGGYGTQASPAYPDWLKLASIEWTSHLLKSRGAQSVVLQGSGQVVDMASLGRHLENAMAILEPHRRRF